MSSTHQPLRWTEPSEVRRKRNRAVATPSSWGSGSVTVCQVVALPEKRATSLQAPPVEISTRQKSHPDSVSYRCA